MQFDLPTPDTGPEAELPDDLQLLAEQLGEDAFHLSTLYPAQSADKWAQTAAAVPIKEGATHATTATAAATPMQLKRMLKWVTVAASLLLTVGLSWNFWPRQQAVMPEVPAPSTELDTIANQPISEAPLLPAGTLLPEGTLAIHPVSRETAINETSSVEGAPDTQQVTVSPGLFMTLSSSEQEALLDLIEDENLPQSSVSF